MIKNYLIRDRIILGIIFGYIFSSMILFMPRSFMLTTSLKTISGKLLGLIVFKIGHLGII